MAELKWHKTKTVRLTAKLIAAVADGRPSDLKDVVTGAEVAFDGVFLHVLPAAGPGDYVAPVTVVPAAALKYLTYEKPSRSAPRVEYR